MIKIQFHPQIENGVIVVPAEYRDRIPPNTQLTVTIETIRIDAESALAQPDNYLLELIKNPIPVKKIEPMSRDEVYERDE